MIKQSDRFEIGSLSLYCNQGTRQDLFTLKINRVRVVRRADGYYAQFCMDADRQEQVEYTGNVVGLDLGLKYFYKDQNDKTARSRSRGLKATGRLTQSFNAKDTQHFVYAVNPKSKI